MRTSVLIIAHNEEKYIGRCIKSVLNQTCLADEIVLVAHNCTDATEAIARSFSITVIPFTGQSGITHARIEGLTHVSGEIILCIDGDSYAAENWIEIMTETLVQRKNVLIGSWIKLKGTVFGWVSNCFNYINCLTKDTRATRWIWGPSMAFWGRDTEVVRSIFQKSFTLSQSLHLTRNVDDFWLALFMSKRGALEVTNKTHVSQHPKEKSSIEAIKRNRENMENALKMEAYVSTNI